RARSRAGGQVDGHGARRGEAQGVRHEAEQAESRTESHQQAARRGDGLQAPEAEEVRAPEHGRRQLLPGGEAAGPRRALLMAEKWIAQAISKPGALHRQLGVPAGEKIPKKKLTAAAGKGGKLGRRARLAQTLSSFHPKVKKPSSVGRY